jgi:glycosyltransferase involved in cell wall biosynthesis
VRMFSESQPVADAPPLVSVAMTAFNSEKWIARAIDSVLLQRTDFAIEIVVGDDCSADGTIAIARSYEQQNPGLIRVLERSENIGMQRNFYETFEACRGKYIAWLDADDYWTDPEKLAIQVQVLESDPSVSVCSHFVRWVTKDEQIVRERFPAIAPGRYGLAEIIRHNFVPSPTTVFRNGVQRELPPWFFDLRGLADWPILVASALSGDIVLLDRVMADYWLSSESAYTSKGHLYQDTMDMEFREQMQSMLPAKWQRHARSAKGRQYEAIAYHLGKQGDFVAAREAALKAFRSPALLDNCGSKFKTLLGATVREAKWKILRGRTAN